MAQYRHPFVQIVSQNLQVRIKKGDFLPGAWLPSERSISVEFGVDRSVVRAALCDLEELGLISRTPRHRPRVSENVMVESFLPQGPATGVQMVAAILPQHQRYSSALAILRGIHCALSIHSAPQRLMHFDNYGDGPVDVQMERRALEAVEAENVAGIALWHMGGAETLPELQRLRDRGTPIVFVDRYPPDLKCDFVGIDNRYSMREAVKYLIELGHRRIAFLTNIDTVSTVQEREKGYREALRLHGYTVDEELIYALPFGHSADISAAEYFFGLPDPPTALVVINDNEAHFFIADVERIGRSVPQDISVIGFDDVDRFSPRPAMLTTMQQPFELMGQRAMELLLDRLTSGTRSGASACQHILLPAPLIVRATCSYCK